MYPNFSGFFRMARLYTRIVKAVQLPFCFELKLLMILCAEYPGAELHLTFSGMLNKRFYWRSPDELFLLELSVDCWHLMIWRIAFGEVLWNFRSSEQDVVQKTFRANWKLNKLNVRYLWLSANEVVLFQENSCFHQNCSHSNEVN